jgi:hypothetical protein
MIPVDSNVRCFKSFSSGSSSPEILEFCPTLRLVYVIAWVQASTCALSSVYILPCNKFVQKVFPQVKKTLLRLLNICKYPGFLDTQSLPHQAAHQGAHQALGTCIHVRYLKYTPQICNYYHSPSMWGLQFFSDSQLEASTRKVLCFQFRLGEVEPSLRRLLFLLHGCVSEF